MSRQRLLHLFTGMERERRLLLERLDAVPAERLGARPANGGWTVAQVITHLAMAEEASLAYLNKKLEVGKHGPASASAWWRFLLLNTAIRLPLKYKAPALIADVPATSYAVARARWDAVRERMRTTYATLPEELIRHDLFKHPVAGRSGLVRGVRFMRQHVRRHRKQIERTVRVPA